MRREMARDVHDRELPSEATPRRPWSCCEMRRTVSSSCSFSAPPSSRTTAALGCFQAAESNPPIARETAKSSRSLAKPPCAKLARKPGLTLSAEDLLPLAHWTTPKGRARCFATWFFLAQVTAGDVRVDGREIKDHLWTTPAAALALRAAGELVLPAPTFVTLVELSTYADRTAAVAAVDADESPRFFSRGRSKSKAAVCSLYGGDVAYSEGDIDRPGPRHRLWMLDRGWRYERSDS